MNYGFVFPKGNARMAADFAREAEHHGWDGFFVWEPVWGVDAWVSLAAAAMQTERIKLGTMISPLSRMRPWDFAGKSASVDNLSRGRVIVGVGLGAVDTGFEQFGEVTDRRTRAELLDESLDIVTGLWRGQPFEYHGQHYDVKPCDFMPPAPPVQRNARGEPHIPIWVVGLWNAPKSMRRALRFDGLLPNLKGRDITPDDVRDMRAFATQHRGDAPFDIVIEFTTPGDRPAEAAAKVRPWADAGATWFIEAMWNSMDDPGAVLTRIRQGPPR